jgi:hypothetical protein
MCNKKSNMHGLSWQNSPLKQKKDPVSIEMFLEHCNMNVGNNDLLVVRDLTMSLLSFAGFLRFDEVSSLPLERKIGLNI